MRPITIIGTVLLAMFFITGCAGFHNGSGDDSKYDLDDQLEVVSEIHKYTMRDWEKVDSQSFILQTGARDYYLIVLRQPSNEIMFTETIRIESSSQMVRPGFNNVTVIHSGKSNSYTIHKIYKFKDYQETRAIKAQLTGK